jgi:chromosome segregation ATPase
MLKKSNRRGINCWLPQRVDKKESTGMLPEFIPQQVVEKTWEILDRVLGEHPRLAALNKSLDQTNGRLQEMEKQLALALAEKQQIQQTLANARLELEKTREERLQWMAKEASVRKELKDCQERNQELLDKVVGLSKEQQQLKQSLLDQKFRTEATPLERNRFEAELAEARARMREAEQRAQKAEEEAARLKLQEKEAARVKEVEEKLVWEARRAESLELALAATVERVRQLEARLEEARQHSAAAAPARRPYRRPRIRLTRPALIQAQP